jgi:hypothetical protein
MLQTAINKIKAEMNGKDPNTKAIGEFIIKELATAVNAAKLAAEGKTLKGAVDFVKGKAKAQANNGMAMVEDKAVFEWVKEYYGIGGAASSAVQAPKDDLNVSLFDLMEG